MPSSDEFLAILDGEDLDSWVTEQRWFASKAREVQVTALDLLPLADDPPLALALLEARFHAGTHELYQLMIGTTVAGPDALADPRSASELARLLIDNRTIDTDHGGVDFHWEAPAGTLESARPSAHLVDADQSNSSLLIDGRVVLKLYRRLEPGANPELEMLRFLSSHGFTDAPGLDGWINLRSELLDATLGVAQGYVADGRDGWELTLDALETADPGLLPQLRDLGRVTGAMHTVLGSDANDPDFAPEVPSSEAMALLTATVDQRIERLFADLPPWPELEPVAGRGEELRDMLAQLSRGGAGGRLIRHHGDLHLGQVLRTPDRWVILDFEGEPARPLIDRRRKRSPLRDVAGMLRSFAYAASAVQLQRGRPAPDDWEDDARRVYLDGYLSAVDTHLLPAGRSAIEQVLTIFEVEKAVYELAYEINNRPEWAGIPATGLSRLLEERSQ